MRSIQLRQIWLFFHSSCQCRCLLCPESLPQTNTVVIVGSICGALFLLVFIAAVVCIAMRMLHNRHDYEGLVWLHTNNFVIGGRKG